ncbi:DUF4168 domain-containing protein [Pontibacter sp. KCTC 32443]|uniref:DUF4168 domain-containing protein n=1 Tax=Pontibacter TaxID=323449 RepID=UPI00164D5BDA|nr:MULTISPECIES: DUF4168 domain-containing protein [Pontibacter]MBC5774437.1 DUF4168 domain-containing protein [Pontibacter sp. KCTC 32443]
MNILHNKIKGFTVAILVVGASAFANTALAQKKQQQQKPVQPATEQTTPSTGITDADLKQFADANNRLMVVQQEGEKAMLAILAEEKLSVEKFSEMAKAHQQQKLGEVKATPAELEAFNKSAQRMMALQPTMEQDMEKAIVKDGMTIEKYEQIMVAFKQDPAIQAKVQTLMGQK